MVIFYQKMASSARDTSPFTMEIIQSIRNVTTALEESRIAGVLAKPLSFNVSSCEASCWMLLWQTAPPHTHVVASNAELLQSYCRVTAELLLLFWQSWVLYAGSVDHLTRRGRRHCVVEAFFCWPTATSTRRKAQTSQPPSFGWQHARSWPGKDQKIQNALQRCQAVGEDVKEFVVGIVVKEQVAIDSIQGVDQEEACHIPVGLCCDSFWHFARNDFCTSCLKGIWSRGCYRVLTWCRSR